MGDFNGVNFENIDLLLVGAMTGIKPITPQKSWIDSIKHNKIMFNSNLKGFI
jgi:protein gp37